MATSLQSATMAVLASVFMNGEWVGERQQRRCDAGISSASARQGAEQEVSLIRRRMSDFRMAAHVCNWRTEIYPVFASSYKQLSRKPPRHRRAQP